MADDNNKEIMEQLEKGIKDAMESERYKAFLKVQSQFHSYSFNNAFLIYLQNPNASRVAGYNTWKNLGRQVMKGEKAISIFAPNPYKYEKLVDKVDSSGKTIINSSTGKAEQVKTELNGLSFKKASVFDISQTDGKELPSICSELIGDSKNAEKIIKAIKDISVVPVVEQPISSGAKGYYSRLENIIAIKEGMSLDQTAKTLIHEYAHSKLHSSEEMSKLDRATKEVQAESVAFIVSNHYGLDTSDYSFDYLASWSGGKELSELRTSFNLIQKTASTIIEDMDKSLSQSKLLETQIETSDVKIATNNKLQDRLEGDKLLDALDLIEEIKSVGGVVNDNGMVTVYHRTSQSNADSIYETGIMTAKEDGLFFSTKESGYNSGYGDAVIKLSVPVESLIIDDVFSDEAHLRLPLNNERSFDVSSMLIKGDIIPCSIKDNVISIYSKEFPAIKHISEDTAKVIDSMNKQRDIPLTIKEIKQEHKAVGKRLELGNDKSDLQEFKLLQSVVDDFKKAQLTEKQFQAKQKALDKQISKASSMEMA